MSKKESFHNLINTHSPDVIFGTEMWLNPNKTVKFFLMVMLLIVKIEQTDMVVYLLPVIIFLLLIIPVNCFIL